VRPWPQVLIFDGATGSGKSTCLEHIRRVWSEFVSVGSKLTTRNRRPTDNDWEFSFVSAIPASDSLIKLTAVGSEYAIEISQIVGSDQCGLIWSTVCTEPRAIEALKSKFNVRLVYVHRCNLEKKVDEIIAARGQISEHEARERKIEAATAVERYAEGISRYDHVVINGGDLGLLTAQVDELLQCIIRESASR